MTASEVRRADERCCVSGSYTDQLDAVDRRRVVGELWLVNGATIREVSGRLPPKLRLTSGCSRSKEASAAGRFAAAIVGGRRVVAEGALGALSEFDDNAGFGANVGFAEKAGVGWIAGGLAAGWPVGCALTECALPGCALPGGKKMPLSPSGRVGRAWLKALYCAALTRRPVVCAPAARCAADVGMGGAGNSVGSRAI